MDNFIFGLFISIGCIIFMLFGVILVIAKLQEPEEERIWWGNDFVYILMCCTLLPFGLYIGIYNMFFV